MADTQTCEAVAITEKPALGYVHGVEFEAVKVTNKMRLAKFSSRQFYTSNWWVTVFRHVELDTNADHEHDNTIL